MPRIEEVIEMHKQVVSLSDAPLAIIAGVIWIFITIGLLVYLIKESRSFSFQEWIFGGFFLVILLSVLGYLSFTIKDYDFSMNEEQWEENYLAPYLESLPENKEYVEDFSQILTNDVDAIESQYINDKDKPVVVEVSMLDKENEAIKKISVQVFIQKEPIDEVYLTYKTIEKNISSEYTADQYYETILHIPNEYKVIAPTN